MSRPQRIDENDVEAWSDERKVVVAAVPQNDVRFFLGSFEDAGIVGTGKYQIANGEMRLILLALFDGALCGIEVGQVPEALYGLAFQVAIGHRMADGDNAKAAIFETSRKPTGHLRLAHTGSHRRDCDDRDARLQHGALGSKQTKIRPGRQCDRCLVHDMGVLDIAVGEDHLVDRLSLAGLGQIAFVEYANAIGISGSGQRNGIASIGDPRDLGRRERNDHTRRIVAIDHIEVVEVAACRAHDDDTARGC